MVRKVKVKSAVTITVTVTKYSEESDSTTKESITISDVSSPESVKARVLRLLERQGILPAIDRKLADITPQKAVESPVAEDTPRKVQSIKEGTKTPLQGSKRGFRPTLEEEEGEEE